MFFSPQVGPSHITQEVAGSFVGPNKFIYIYRFEETLTYVPPTSMSLFYVVLHMSHPCFQKGGVFQHGNKHFRYIEYRNKL